MMAVIISHEIAHSIQRHFVETHGIASFMLMLGDISRGLLWMVTESLGP
jgi:predicted Zn-dependent protease